MPGNWRDFLRDDINKQELFEFFSKKIVSANNADGKEVFVTSGVRVLTKGTARQVMSCDHEEAGTRLLVHVIDLLSAGCSTYLVHTVDTNVFIIYVGKFHYLIRLNVSVKI